MAPSPKKSATKITRISASDGGRLNTKSAAVKQAAAKVKPAISSAKKLKGEKTEKSTRRSRRNPLAPVWRYLKGSWYELTQVRWPDRRATWGMTGALILFTLFFVVVILLLDYGFAQLFKLIMGTN